MKDIYRKIPLIPVLFAASSVVSLFLHNINEVTLPKLFPPFLAVIILSAVLSCFMRRFLGATKGDIAATVFVILFFSFGQAASSIGNSRIGLGQLVLDRHHIIFFLWISVMMLVFLLLKKTGRTLDKAVKFLFPVSLIVFVIPVAGIAYYGLNQRIHPPVTSPLILPDISASSKRIKNLPDIYYIVPDSYAAPNNFPKYFSSDDSSFVSYLKKKGFYVAENSTSNYPTTILSLSSTLNMEYIDYLSRFRNSSDISLAAPLIEDSNVLKLFRSLGYKYYQMGSWWWPTQDNRNADGNFSIQTQNIFGIDEFSYSLIQSTMMGAVLDTIRPERVIGESVEDKRTIIEYEFDTIPRMVELPGPKFVLIHIIAPHPPYVFDQNCGYTNQEKLRSLNEELNYSNQVACINRKLEKSIDGIIKKSDKPPVILLQSDEGAKFIADKISPPEYWKNADDNLLQMKFPILAAYFLPGIAKNKLYSSVTPVNSFRMIFNLYFSADLPVLPDRNYIYTDPKHLYNFKEVTSQLKN